MTLGVGWLISRCDRIFAGPARTAPQTQEFLRLTLHAFVREIHKLRVLAKTIGRKHTSKQAKQENRKTNKQNTAHAYRRRLHAPKGCAASAGEAAPRSVDAGTARWRQKRTINAYLVARRRYQTIHTLDRLVSLFRTYVSQSRQIPGLHDLRGLRNMLAGERRMISTI